jgi:hypothetical protein
MLACTLIETRVCSGPGSIAVTRPTVTPATLTSSPTYNPTADENKPVILSLRGVGHTVYTPASRVRVSSAAIAARDHRREPVSLNVVTAFSA